MLRRFKVINEWLNDRAFARAGYLRYYRDLIGEGLASARTIIHFGAGSGGAAGPWQLFPGKPFVSVDLDWRQLRLNPNRLKVVADGARLPFALNSLDMIATEHTFEHLERPREVLAEIHRVLRPGRGLIFAIPNGWSYVSLVARLTPFVVHRWYQNMMSGHSAGDAPDTSRTFYRLNTMGALRAAARECGLGLTLVRTFAGDPSYTLVLPPPLHLLAVALHKLLDAFDMLAPLRVNIVGCLVKEDRHGGG